jgi:hypothetical protein
MSELCKIVVDEVNTPAEYMCATTVATKLTKTISISSSRMIHRGVVFTLNDLNILKSRSLYSSLSISCALLNHGLDGSYPPLVNQNRQRAIHTIKRKIIYFLTINNNNPKNSSHSHQEKSACMMTRLTEQGLMKCA